MINAKCKMAVAFRFAKSNFIKLVCAKILVELFVVNINYAFCFLLGANGDLLIRQPSAATFPAGEG